MTQIVKVIEPYKRHRTANVYAHEHFGNGEIDRRGNVGLDSD